MSDIRKWMKLMENIESPMQNNQPIQESDNCVEIYNILKPHFGEFQLDQNQVEEVLYAMSKEWSRVNPLLATLAKTSGKQEDSAYEPEHEGVEESATSGGTSAGAIATGVKEAGKCRCRNYNCTNCFPEKVNENKFRDLLGEAPDDAGPDDHVGREGTDVDFNDISKQGGVEDLGTDPDLSDIEKDLNNVKAHSEPGEDVSSLIADIEEYQGMGISKAKRMFDINQLHQMPADFVKKVHNMVCGENEIDDTTSPDITHESMLKMEEAEVKDIIESYRKMFKIHK